MLRIIREEEPPKPSTKLSTSRQALADAGGQPRHGAGEADQAGPRRTRLDRHEGAGEGPQPALRDGQRPGRRRAALPVRTSRCWPCRRRRDIGCGSSCGGTRGRLVAASLVVWRLVCGSSARPGHGARHRRGRSVTGHSEARRRRRAVTAAQQSERDPPRTVGRLSARSGQARARRFSRQMGQRLDSLDALAKPPPSSLTSGCATRPSPPWPSRTSASGRPGMPCLLVTLVGAFDGQYRLYARGRRQGSHQHPQSSGRPGDPEHRLRSKLSGVFFCSAPTAATWPTSKTETRCRCGVWPTGSRCCARNRGKPAGGLSARTAGSWRSARKVGSFASTWRPVRKSTAGRCPKSGTRMSWPFTRTTAGWPSATRTSNFASVYDATNGELVANLPVGGQEQSSRSSPGIRTASVWPLPVSDPGIQIWDVAAKRKVATLEGHVQNVTSLTFPSRRRPPGLHLLGRHPCGSGILRRDGSSCSCP